VTGVFPNTRWQAASMATRPTHLARPQMPAARAHGFFSPPPQRRVDAAREFA